MRRGNTRAVGTTTYPVVFTSQDGAVRVVTVEGMNKTNGLQMGDIILSVVSQEMIPHNMGAGSSAYKRKVEKELKKADELGCSVILFIRRLPL
jgi:hypothetical protein